MLYWRYESTEAWLHVPSGTLLMQGTPKYVIPLQNAITSPIFDRWSSFISQIVAEYMKIVGFLISKECIMSVHIITT